MSKLQTIDDYLALKNGSEAVREALGWNPMYEKASGMNHLGYLIMTLDERLSKLEDHKKSDEVPEGVVLGCFREGQVVGAFEVVTKVKALLSMTDTFSPETVLGALKSFVQESEDLLKKGGRNATPKPD